MPEPNDLVHIKDLTPDPKNRRKHNPRNIGMLVDALQAVGAARSIVIDEHGEILAGNGLVEAAAEAGLTKVKVVEADGSTVVAVRRTGLTDEQKRALAIYDNRTAELANWNTELLRLDAHAGLDLKPFFTNQELSRLLTEQDDTVPAKSLAERFIVPPFSVLDARQGYWQERKRAWLSIGIESEVGRTLMHSSSGTKAGKNSAMKRLTGRLASETEDGEHIVSIFDPVLCELAYRWFCPQGGLVLDPFAGGSVRGLVASRLGRAYVGIELRAEQVAANGLQSGIAGSPAPVWIAGDARDLPMLWPAGDADFVFTCPPYGDLEVYSDDPRDLSTLDYDDFIDCLAQIFDTALTRLRQDRFAAVVVGDFRDRDGLYHGFPADVIRIIERCGLRLYNDAVVVTALGSLRLRAARLFTTARKLGKAHQNVLVFCKGDIRRAVSALDTPEYGTPDDSFFNIRETPDART